MTINLPIAEVLFFCGKEIIDSADAGLLAFQMLVLEGEISQ